MKKKSVLQVIVANVPPDGLELRGEVTPEEFDMPQDDRQAFTAPLRVELLVSRVSSGILCRGRIEGQLRCRCDRCLSYFTRELVIPEACCFLEDVDEEIIDLTPYMREDILLGFPQGLLCREDCRGLCVDCGQNLNVRECSCRKTRGSGGVWSALENLDLDSENDENS